MKAIPLALFSPDAKDYAWIDVRSETEFQQGAIPGFLSRPLLYQDERRQVGICYKQQGQAQAIALGHELVDPHRQERVAAWLDLIRASPRQQGFVSCWRGGLRSQIATQWIREAGGDAQQVEGGYKELRRQLLVKLAEPPPMLVLAGLTGSGKTELLQKLPARALDIEAAAGHRGSSFGRLPAGQPSQGTFENQLAFGLFRPWVLVEDESRMLGRLSLPETFYERMLAAPLIELLVPQEQRIQLIYQDYVLLPLAQAFTPEQLQIHLEDSLLPLRRRLDKHYIPILESLRRAFTQENSLEGHRDWIQGLLSFYYDRRYSFAMQRVQRKIIFRGDPDACLQWLQAQRGFPC